MNIELMVKHAEILQKKIQDARIDYYRYVQNVFVEILKDIGLDGDVTVIGKRDKGRIFIKPNYDSLFSAVKVEFHKYKKDGTLAKSTTNVGNATTSYGIEKWQVDNFIDKIQANFRYEEE